MLTVKYLKQCKVFKFFFVRNSSLQEMANFDNNISLKISYSNLDLWRPADTVQNLESLGFSGRVDSPYMHTFLDSNSIKRTYLDKFPRDKASNVDIGILLNTTKISESCLTEVCSFK